MGTRPKASDAEPARRAHIALQQGEHGSAEELLLRLIAVAPDDPVHAEQLARLYQEQGRHGLAIAFAQRAASLDPDDPRLARVLASMLETGGEPDLAHEAYLTAGDSNPRHPQAWLALSRLEREQGRPVTGEQYARRAVAAAPHSAAAYGELARVLFQINQTRAAHAALAIGLRLAPDDADLLALRVWAAASAHAGTETDENEAIELQPEPP
jgi:predicted Zn-dependent protease